MKRILIFLLFAVLLLGGCYYDKQDLNDAYNRGFEAGKSAAVSSSPGDYNKGFKEGKNQGYTEGHDDGYNEGYTAGVDNGYQSGREDGYAEGYDEGYDVGFADGVSSVYAGPTQPPVTYSYVANRNTMKFHLPDCSSVNDIKESNRINWNGTRDELIAKGYVPCKRCNP